MEGCFFTAMVLVASWLSGQAFSQSLGEKLGQEPREARVAQIQTRESGCRVALTIVFQQFSAISAEFYYSSRRNSSYPQKSLGFQISQTQYFHHWDCELLVIRTADCLCIGFPLCNRTLRTLWHENKDATQNMCYGLNVCVPAQIRILEP